MTATTMKLGLAAFAALGAAALVNITMLQPNAGRVAVSRPAAQSTVKPQQAAPGEARSGARSAPAAETPTVPAAAAPAPPAPPTPSATTDVTRAIQRELKDRGYDAGTPDGQPGLMTRAAIMAYEHDRNLPLTAEPTPQLLKLIVMNTSLTAARTGPTLEQSVQATHVIRTVQQSLVTLGYAPGKVDGRLGDDTVRAIRDFELDQGLPETGRVSGQLVARLSRLAGQGRLNSTR